MPDIVVTAQNRQETGKNTNRRLRVQGLIPGVLYGGKAKKPVPVSVSPKEIGTILRSKTGENTLFDLDLDGSRRKVILKEFQLEPIKGALLHADFYEVALDKPLQVNVHVELVGTPVGVKVQGGIVDWVTRELEVECLPARHPREDHRRHQPPRDRQARPRGRHQGAGQGHDPDRARRRDRARGRAACGGGRSRRRKPLRRPRAKWRSPRSSRRARPPRRAKRRRSPRPPRSPRRRPRRRRRSSRRRQAAGAPCAWWWVSATPASGTAGPATTPASWWWTRWPPARGRTRGREEADAWVAEAEVGGEGARLVKPLTFMNRSGIAVARLLEATGASSGRPRRRGGRRRPRPRAAARARARQPRRAQRAALPDRRPGHGGVRPAPPRHPQGRAARRTSPATCSASSPRRTSSSSRRWWAWARTP